MEIPAKGSRLDGQTMLLVAFSVAMSIAAQTSLRRGMADLGDLGGLQLFFEAAQTLHVPLGILFYAMGTVSWLIVLGRIDLAVAYPLGSLNHVFIAVISATVLHELVPPTRWAGVLLIVVGIWVIARGERRRPRT